MGMSQATNDEALKPGDATEVRGQLPSAQKPRQCEASRQSRALASSMSAPARHASPFERMSFHGRQGAQGMAWPADGPLEAHAFERIQSFNAQAAMLVASTPVETAKLPAALCPAAGTKDGQMEDGSRAGAKECSLSSLAQGIAPHLR